MSLWIEDKSDLFSLSYNSDLFSLSRELEDLEVSELELISESDSYELK